MKNHRGIKMKSFDKHVIKYYLFYIIIALAIVILLFYSFSYIKYNSLSFTREEFLFFTMIALFLLIMVISVYLNYKLHKIIIIINKIGEEMADIEDNIIQTSDTKFSIVVSLINELIRSKNNEKESVVEPCEKMDGEK